MEQLRLAGVHDDGEHLIVETPDSTRYLLTIDQQLRQTIQHARRKPPARGRGGASYGPRDIQARFRAGASVEDIVAECGWEAERVRRYEWPILAERSHMVSEACRVKVSGTDPAHDGYRSVFEGEPRTLEETVLERAQQLGVQRSSLDWDAWLREDQLWTVQLSFTASETASGPAGTGPARWSFNPATQSVRPENDWARALMEEPRETGPLGTAAPAAPAAAPSPQLRRLQHEASQADDLLDVLQSRRGRRLGSDETADDRLAEILGRGMGSVEQRPRPIDAPEDSPVFDRPIQPAASQVAEEQALRGEGIEIVDDSTPARHETAPGHDAPAEDPSSGGAAFSAGPSGTVHCGTETSRDAASEDGEAETPAAESWVDVTGTEAAAEVTTGEDGAEPAAGAPTTRETVAPVAALHPRSTSPAAPSDAPEHTGADGSATRDHGADTSPAETSPAETRQDAADTQQGGEHDVTGTHRGSDRDDDAPAPGPRGRTPKAKRSSVPSWDDIVFGANRS
ncbi:septation protein SepH [Kocuria rhizophila]|uniref:septation protein SepH n=1 Tax=Kocuria rhizophila TaxID=72000 RepID=UPI00073D4055|nr:septation protein SepH [Kocuria rhizophila]